MIIKALESLATSYTSDTLKAFIEKYNAIIEKEGVSCAPSYDTG